MRQPADFTSITISDATAADAASILALQKRAFLQEAQKYGDDYNITPITEKLPQMLDVFKSHRFVKAMTGPFLIGSARANLVGGTCLIGRVIVEPIFQGRGYGRMVLDAIEARFPEALRYELFTGKKSPENIRFYGKAGYSIIGEFVNADGFVMVTMEKRSG
jgi:GNAT superfamily N-acetyltransferase